MFKVKPSNLFIMRVSLIFVALFVWPVLTVSGTSLEKGVRQQMRCKGSSPTLSVRSSPGTEFEEIAKISTTNGIVVGDFVDGWYRVSVSTSVEGWVSGRDIDGCDSGNLVFMGKTENEMRDELATAGYPFAGTASPDEILRVYSSTAVDVDNANSKHVRYSPGTMSLFTRWASQVSPDNSLPHYPRPQLVRSQWLNLNGMWGFQRASTGENPPFNKTLSSNILVPFPPESALSGVMSHIDRAWYRREVEIPSVWNGQRIILHFGAVDWEATVYINGHHVGTNQGGYNPFSFDITDFLHYSGVQEIVVGVFDPTDSGEQARGKQVHNPIDIWYTASTGIWQTVWLEPVPVTRVDYLRIVPDVARGGVMLETSVVGDLSSVIAHLKVRSKGKLVSSYSVPVNQNYFVPIRNPVLWSPDNPHLYDVEINIVSNGTVVDKVTSYFGLRTISISHVGNVPRIHLNGRPFFHIGVLDQGYWPDGLYTAPTDEALVYDLDMVKHFGYNLVRKHMKIEPQRWYYWADRKGVLVWQDMPMGNNWSDWGKQRYKAELQQMISNLYNHPSVVTWVLFNERWGEFDVSEITEYTKSLDPFRLVVGATGYADKGVGDIVSYHSYNQIYFPEVSNGEARILAEWGGLGLPVDGHLWTEDDLRWGEPSYVQPVTDTNDFVEWYRKYVDQIGLLKQHIGLSGAIYSQITDVERESTGLITYDREIVKVDPRLMRSIHSFLR
ncbi:MAG: glycoside hydrolase family 2 [Anaerolineaceae bacterium]|nr:glycoside hydrolase family 2 [Anaerolineaceae bacterium]